MFDRRHFRFAQHARLFERGEIKYVILDYLKDKPGHGYEIIRALEERFGGLYSPSAGSIYPALQLLEDMGHISAAELDGKKVYTITDQGRQFLSERKETVARIKRHVKGWLGPHRELHATMHELHDLGRLIGHQGRNLGPDKLAQVRAVISHAHSDIEDIVAQSAAPSGERQL